MPLSRRPLVCYESLMLLRGFVFASLATFALAAATLADAEACSCAPPPPPVESMERATAVFVGEVTAINANADGFAVEFAVSKMYRGPRAPSLTVQTARDSAGCGYNFTQGQRYLVYAGGEPGSLSVNICGRTASLDTAADDIAALDAAEGPADAPDQTPPDTTEPGTTNDGTPPPPPPQTVQRKGCGCQGTTPTAGGLALLAVVGFMLRRRRV